MKYLLPSFLLFTGASALLFSHEIATHKRIGDAAVAYLQALYPGNSRPILLGSAEALHNSLQIGAEHEDDSYLFNVGFNPYGRFIFHFTPALDNTLTGLLTNIDANNCSSVNWNQSSGSPNGATGCQITCASILPGLSSLCSEISLLPAHVNSFRWDQDLSTDSTGAPTNNSVTGFGYVVHLLEDLGSPPHTRNDAHPCPFGTFGNFYCDQFEKFNDNADYAPFGDPFCVSKIGSATPTALPCSTDQPSTAGAVWTSFIAHTISAAGVQTQVIPTSGFANPADFTYALQRYTCENYYSNRTVFQACDNGQPGPVSILGKDDTSYFYGACVTSNSGIPVSEIAGTCHNGLRKIAHKGAPYWVSCLTGCDPTRADIDTTIAQEQFAELGPVIAQHVAAFIMFYAPNLTVNVSGAGTGTVTSAPGNLNCTTANATCSSLFAQSVNGPPSITLTAKPDPGSTFTGWSGACPDTAPSTKVTMSGDQTCTATFNTSQTFPNSYTYTYLGGNTGSGSCNSPGTPVTGTVAGHPQLQLLPGSLSLSKTAHGTWIPQSITDQGHVAWLANSPPDIWLGFPPVGTFTYTLSSTGLMTATVLASANRSIQDIFNYTETDNLMFSQTETVDLTTGSYTMELKWMDTLQDADPQVGCPGTQTIYIDQRIYNANVPLSWFQ